MAAYTNHSENDKLTGKILPLTHTGYKVGFRGWTKSHTLMRSLTASHMVWQPYKPMAAITPLAQCTNATTMNYKTSSFSELGIFSYKNIDLLREYINYIFIENESLAGEVALWGEIQEHEFGYRSQYAYPISLSDQKLALMYGCEYKPYYFTHVYDCVNYVKWGKY